MAKRAKSAQGAELGHGGQAVGGAAEDADAILDTGLRIIRTDLERIHEDAEAKRRRLDLEEAQTVAGYVRALGGIARARSGRAAGPLRDMTMEELAAEVAKIPEVAAAIEADR